MVTRSGLTLVGIGLVVGLPLALLMFRVTIRSLDLFNMDLGYGYPTALAGMLIAVAVLSTILPALRASSVAPVEALKE
jgi:ABC-type antimicrobial peptide transport system permease subunit